MQAPALLGSCKLKGGGVFLYIVFYHLTIYIVFRHLIHTGLKNRNIFDDLFKIIDPELAMTTNVFGWTFRQTTLHTVCHLRHLSLFSYFLFFMFAFINTPFRYLYNVHKQNKIPAGKTHELTPIHSLSLYSLCGK